MAENAPPGWYQSETDPNGTERYWDGSQWSPETRAVAAPPPVAPGSRVTPHGRELASPGQRVGARFLDSIILAVLLVPLVLQGIDFEGGSFTDSVVSGRLLLGGLIAGGYEIGMTALKSATLGKMAVGIEIVRKVDGQTPIGFSTATMRWLPFAIGYLPVAALSNVSTLVLLASFIMLFVDDLRRTVYDYAGQTYVVRKPQRI